MHAWQMTAHQASQAMARGELRSEDLIRSCLERIAAREPAVRAWAHVAADAALQQARRLDREPRRSPLHGIPVGVKDVLRTADQPTRHNSPLYTNLQPAEDAVCVGALRALGAVILGKTETLEFACGGQFPPTRHPQDPRRTPGGSSSGCGAAVADGMVPLALGTQTGGSTIRPASFCGVYAMKPTLGRIATEGMKAYAVHLDTIGLFGRSVGDLRMMADAYRLSEPGSATPPVAGLRIGLCRTPMWAEAEPGGQAALLQAAEQLRAAGAVVDEVELSGRFTDINRIQDEIMQDGGRSAFLDNYYGRPDLLHADFQAKVHNHLGLTPQRMRHALDTVAACQLEFEQTLEGRDAVLTLSAPGVAPLGLHTQGMATFNRMWTALQVPCITVPGMTGTEGLPIGVQLVQRRYDDQRLLDVAAAVATVIDAKERAWN